MTAMSRPCVCSFCGPDSPYGMPPCNHCRLYETDQRYRTLWGGGVLPSRRTLPCVKLGPETGERGTCPSCSGHVEVKLRACSAHGQCTTHKAVPGIACCVGCPDYALPDPFGDQPPIRNLLYHILPVSGTGTWQRNVGMLLRRIRLFNGRRVVAILTDAGKPHRPGDRGHRVPLRLDPPEHVRDAFAGHVHEFIEVPNDPELREVATFEELFSRVETTDQRQVTLYSHSKGVTQPIGHPAHRWAEVLYETNLDYWPLVESTLRTHACAGSFLRHVHGWAESESEWHYSGSFFWFRNRDIFSRPDWRKIERFWSGIEPWISTRLPKVEAGCLFFPFLRPGPGLYMPEIWRDEIEPALAKWKVENAAHRQGW